MIYGIMKKYRHIAQQFENCMYIYQYNILEVFDMKNRILKSIAAALALCTAMLAFTACSGSGDTSGTAEGTGEATVDTTGQSLPQR